MIKYVNKAVLLDRLHQISYNHTGADKGNQHFLVISKNENIFHALKVQGFAEKLFKSG
jgi:hypothetical protein